MKLISANLTNFCQHQDLQVKFAPGLTAIVGRNGSGKSNLIKAVYAAVTGDFGRNDGVKSDNIAQSAPPDAQSKINVILEHGDSTLSITRSLRPVATRLRISATGTPDTIITKAQEATEAITNILGVSSRILSDYVFVDQWLLFNFLSMMPAERAKAFQRLFRTERAEVLWKGLGDYHDSIVIPTPGISKDVIIKRLTENRAQHDHLSKELTHTTSQENAYDIAGLRQTHTDYERKQTLEAGVARLKAKTETLKTDVVVLESQLAVLVADDTTLTTYLTANEKDYVDAKYAISAWTTHQSIEKNRQQIQQCIDDVHADIDGHTSSVPVKPIDYIEQEKSGAWYKDYNTTSQEMHRLKTLVDTITSGVDVCSACGSVMTDAKAHLQHHQITLLAVTERYNYLRDIRTRSRAYDTESAAFETWQKNSAQRLQDLQGQLANLAETPVPKKPYNELNTFVRDYDGYVRSQQRARQDINTTQLQHQHKKSVYEQLQQELDELQVQLNSLAVTKEMAEQAQKDLQIASNLSLAKVRIEARVQMTAQLIQNDEAALAQLEQVEADAQVTREWASYCLDMRHILHRDNLPRVVAQNYLELMQDEINNLLVRFGSTFSIITDESLSFVATFHDGRKVPAGRLSGGEKVLLALAFRVAVNDIFAKDLGMLVLDEPTAGLDEGNLQCLRVAITRLKELSTARGLQVIMITHEQELHNLFDHVIEVGKAA
jgi:DNA repair exonuclease SbcCD ATPase subunit